ncbi:unnamed protein product [Brugia pahangi]|uniref:Ovule protein n=1 Tax=Brugia pahangi TaxID=6280 RepID=A0A0N4TR55_BRUPA|nr:unnamed protein product [Brugia pahangi]
MIALESTVKESYVEDVKLLSNRQMVHECTYIMCIRVHVFVSVHVQVVHDCLHSLLCHSIHCRSHCTSGANSYSGCHIPERTPPYDVHHAPCPTFFMQSPPLFLAL